ncbi:MAG: DUF1638 domain-containing protein [Syntrophorhabdales bacterium]|jgi:hypothetical protein
MKIAVIACDIMKRELGKLLADRPEVTKVIFLEMALHVHPEKLKEAIKEQINSIKDEIDAVFLGYGFCQSLRGIENEVDVPVVMPQLDDCIAILFTPERYAAEKRKEVGTWFMTPGWADAGADMVIKELYLDRAKKYGKDPLEMARRLFTHYRRGIFIDTDVGESEHFAAKAEAFCKDFNLKLERTASSSKILEDVFEKCKKVLCRTKRPG